MTRLRTIVTRAGIGIATAFALVALLHLPMFSGAFSGLAAMMGCPISLDGGDPKAVEAMRLAAVSRKCGATEARSRPALDFELATTTREQVRSRLSSSNCEWLRADTAVRCSDPQVSSVSGLAASDLYAQFDDHGVLVALDVFRTAGSAEQAIDHLTTANRAMSAQVGPSDAETPSPMSAKRLASHFLHRYAHEFRYRRYVAKLSATNMGGRGIRVREQYQYVPSEPST